MSCTWRQSGRGRRPAALLERAARWSVVLCLFSLLPGRHGVSRASAQQLNFGALKLGADAYGYEYLPVNLPGARPKFELYALSLLASANRGPWLFDLDYRIRTSKLRPFYHSITWVQQAYIGVHTPAGDIRAGSFYRRVGLVWDGSFFGNIEYFDGLMLDPEAGVDLSGTHALTRVLGLNYSVQYFATDVGINGSLQGRDYVSQPGARMRNEWTARVAPVWHPSSQTSLTMGASFADGTIRRASGPNAAPNDVRRQWAADATLKDMGWLVYGEAIQQSVLGPVVEPPRNATYTLFGARRASGRVQPRFNFSSASYHGFQPHREYILQPGITVQLWRGLSAIAEYDFWRTTAPAPHWLDQSLNLVLWYHL